MDIITINLNLLKKLKLNINEYLALYTIYLKNKQHINIPFELIRRDEIQLTVAGLLKVKENHMYKLSEKGLEIFEGGDFFNEFYKTFPRTVPTEGQGQRVVSTNDAFGISAAFTRKIWDRQTKGDRNMQQHIIKCLKLELSDRINHGTIKFLHNIDTWLRQGGWEKYEYLTNEKNPNNIIKL